ncbi:MAG: 1-acyl-sn-glycerol-3-phosphate acyltransferase [Aldersonia sp.]|nr:1-acyl-sn-glycerol-3-phosphate acyltransferase [Aldersonia sp.]
MSIARTNGSDLSKTPGEGFTVNFAEEVSEAVALRDATVVGRLLPVLRLVVKTWFRSEVSGIDRIPDGGALLVSNHSGGFFAPDVPVIAVAFADRFGSERPLFVLAHDLLFLGPAKHLMARVGLVPANRRNAADVLRSGETTIVFPGGDYDAYRPTSQARTIDFGGRTGYVQTALDADVPLVPIVSDGGQDVQLFLTRGEGLAALLRLEKTLRSKIAPLSFGVPFGLTLGLPPNLPLPAKIRTRVLDPIDIRAEFGPDPDVADVDREVRARMQTALDELARKRRFPLLG